MKLHVLSLSAALSLLALVPLAQAHDETFIDEATLEVVSNEQDAADVSIPTISLETESASLPLADATEVRTEAKERTIPDDITIAVAEMREVANENVSERCNDLRVDTKRELTLH